MDVLRTPDDRFADLPGCPYEPRTRRPPTACGWPYVDEGSGPTCCCCTASRRGATSTGTMVPVLVDAGLPRASRPTWSASAARDKPTAGRGLHLRAARRVAALGAVRRARPDRRDAGLPGLGRAARAAAGRRAPGALRPGRAPPTPACRTAPAGCPTRGGSSATSSSRTDGPAGRLPRRLRLRRAAAARGAGGVRRAVPGRLRTRPVPSAFPDLIPQDRRRPGDAGQPAGLGGAARASTSRSCAPSPTSTRSPPAASGCLLAQDPRRGRASRTRRSPAAATSCRRTAARARRGRRGLAAEPAGPVAGRPDRGGAH